MADRRARDEVIRRRRPRIPAGIPYATVEALAADMHGIGDDGLSALRARLHSLRRLDFPNGVSGSSGRHFDYGLADVLGVLCALELAEAYVPPAAAVAMVREGWPEIAGCALAGFADAAERGMVTVLPNALFQALELPGSRASDTLHVEAVDLAPPPTGRRSIDLAAGALARTALARLEGIDPRSARMAREQMADLELRFGTGAALARPAAHDGRLLSDGPYWHRARSLASTLARGPVGDSDRRRALWQLGYVSRPAPVEGWKMRVEVHPDLSGIGFAAALAVLAYRDGLRTSRARMSAADAERAWARMVEVIGGRDAVAARLVETAEAGERYAAVRPAKPRSSPRSKASAT